MSGDLELEQEHDETGVHDALRNGSSASLVCRTRSPTSCRAERTWSRSKSVLTQVPPRCRRKCEVSPVPQPTSKHSRPLAGGSRSMRAPTVCFFFSERL